MAKDHSDNDMKPAAIFNDALKTLFTVIWCHQTYGKGPLRCQERNHAAATWAARVLLYA